MADDRDTPERLSTEDALARIAARAAGASVPLNLTRADLDGANLTGADLKDADLTGAYLDGAILTDANLTDANLKRAILADADLKRTYLARADLTGAKPTGAELSFHYTCPGVGLSWERHA